MTRHKKNSATAAVQRKQPRRQKRSKPNIVSRPKPVMTLSQAADYTADALWLAILFCGAVFALALFSFSMQDPSWSRGIVDNGEIRNLAGLSGAYLADAAYYLFGFSVWWLLLALSVWLYRNFRLFRGQGHRPYLLPLGLVGLMLLLSGSAMLEVLLFKDTLGDKLPAGAGGIFGSLSGRYFYLVFGKVGSVLLLGALVWIGIVLLVQISWSDWLRSLAAAWQRFGQRDMAATVSATGGKSVRRMVRKAKNITATAINVPQNVVSSRQHRTIYHHSAETGGKGTVAAEQPVVERRLQTDLFERQHNETVNRYALPDLQLLAEPVFRKEKADTDFLQQMAEKIETKLAEFGVDATVLSVTAGPVVTLFEIEPAKGVKGSQILGLSKDLARCLSVQSVRVAETIAGKHTMGLEVPNEQRQAVFLREILSSPVFTESESRLTVALGKDIGGVPVAADLAKMTHVLVGGMTGSGKSVGINAMILSILYKAMPDEVRFIMIDPKMIELSPYDGIPHLLCPVITDMAQAEQALNWCLAEMDKRYRLMQYVQTRDLAGFNRKIKEAAAQQTVIHNPFSPNPDEPEALETLPQIVVVVDELADLMMTNRKTVETQIIRLAQKARAAGIHLILATQRPSVDVVTSLIKANVPTRMAYTVKSRIDSRIILDQIGAEELLKDGDMLFLQPGGVDLIRIQGAFVSDKEVQAVAGYCRRRQAADYVEGLLDGAAAQETLNAVNPNANSDVLFDDAAAFVLESGKTSISALQRKLRIGYNRAANLIQALEEAGILSAPDEQRSGQRKILADRRPQ